MVIPESEKEKLEKRINVDERAISAAIQAAKEDAEFRGRLADFILREIDKDEFKEKLIEEALKDSELRKKIMLEVVRKLG